MENRLKANSSQNYMVGNSLTIADVLMCNLVWTKLLNESQPAEKLAPVERVLKKHPVLWDYAVKRKEDFPRLRIRPPMMF